MARVSEHNGPGSSPTSTTGHPSPPTGRSRIPARISARVAHRGVGDAGGRRQGQGAQGGRPAGHRLRSRRAGLPDARLHRGRRGRGLRGTGEPPVHPGRRPARVEGRHRGQDAARLGVRRGSGAGPGHQRRQAGGVPSLRNGRGPGRRGAAPGAVLDHLPRGHHAGRRRAGRGVRRRGPGLPGDRRPARGRPDRPDQGPAVLLAQQPDRRGLPARPGAGDRRVGARERHLGDHGRDLRTPDVRRRALQLDAGRGARAGRHLHRRSTASRRPTP